MSKSNTLLFLPDISGFTKFVNETDIDHSQHIIQELLEVMLDANSNRMEVAEIEGDAIFFYSDKEFPALEVDNLAQDIFLAFHSHIKQYHKQRICNCGACSSAVNLKLKFIVHSGEVGFININKTLKKPHGKEVVVAHRLLKNKIGHSQYILYSDQYRAHYGMDENATTLLESGNLQINEIGTIGFKYTLIDSWESKVKIEDGQALGYKSAKPVVQEVLITDTLPNIYQLISDFKYRSLWNEEAISIEYDSQKLNRLGTEHYCIVNKEKLSFETVTQSFDNNPYVYGEKLKNSKLFKDFANYFLLAEIDESTTRVRMEFHLKSRSFFQSLMAPMFKRKISKKMVSTLNKIKEISESQDINRFNDSRGISEKAQMTA